MGPVTAACARQVLASYFGKGLPEGEEQQGSSSYHYRRLPFNGLIQPEWNDDRVERFIRAMYFPPFDGAAFSLGGENGKRVLVNSVEDYQQLRQQAMATAAAGASAAAAVAATATLPAAAAAAVATSCVDPPGQEAN